MRVLLVNKFHYLRGGSERYYFTLASLLEKAGHEVFYFAINDDKNIETKDKKYFLNNVGTEGGIIGKVRMIKNMNYSKEAYKKIKEEIKEVKPDLAILNLVHKQISLSIVDALKENNIPIFWVVHDLIFVCPSYTMLDGNGNICEKCINGDFKNCLKNKCIHGSTLLSYLSYREANFIKKHEFYKDIDLFITPSLFYKNKLEESKLIKSRVVHLPNPCENEPVSKVNENPKYYVLFFGRLSKEKGVDILLKAISKTDLKLVVAGEGPMKKELLNLAKELKIDEQVEFVGFKKGKELEDLIYHSRFVALPSTWYENGPYSAIEALSFAKPLIVSSYGGLPELISKNGYIFNSEEELVKILKSIPILEKEDYLKMCNNSLELYKNNYYLSNYVDKIVKLYEEVKRK